MSVENTHGEDTTNTRECTLCGSTDSVWGVWVENEETGEKKKVDLCPDCEDLGSRYARGEDVDWDEVLDR